MQDEDVSHTRERERERERVREKREGGREGRREGGGSLLLDVDVLDCSI